MSLAFLKQPKFHFKPGPERGFFVMSYLSQELPRELKEFGKLFDSMVGRFGYNDIFYDFIDYQIACWLITGDKEVGERLEKKYEKNYPMIRELFVKLIHAHQNALHFSEWYDGLGIVYETITSKWKSSAMGQFFTPPSLVDLMTQITQGELEKGQRKLISDPACGSGRFLIASHAHAPGNYQCGQDLDPVCAKMTAINMLLHGCVGEVACMNCLTMDWYFAYEVNPHLTYYGFPSLRKVEKFEDSIFYADYQKFKAKPEKTAQNTEQIKVEIIEQKINKKGQYTLF